MAKFLQEEQNEENDMEKRISDLAKVHQIRDQLVEKSTTHQKRMKPLIEKQKRTIFKLGTWCLNGMH